MPLSRCLPIIALVAALGVPASADILYVDDDAPPGGDGLGWDTALQSLVTALDLAAASGGTVTEVRVAQGTYRLVEPEDPLSDCCVVRDTPGCETPDCEAAVCLHLSYCCDAIWDAACAALAEILCGDLCDEQPAPPPPTFALPDGVALRGGFAGLGAADPDVRDVDAYPTVLDGDVGNDDDLFPDRCCAPHDSPGCADPSPDGACEAAVCAELPYCCDTVWDLLCAAMAAAPYGGCDLEIACPEIAGNAQVVTAIDTGPDTALDGFTVTRGAPGVLVEGGAPCIKDCRIVDNRVYGVKVYEGAATITACVFSGNAAQALQLYAEGATVSDSLFTGNASRWQGGGVSIGGSSTIRGCTLSDNDAYSGGGGILLGWDAVAIECTVSANGSIQAGGGGTIHGGTLLDCRFSHNVSMSAGGGLRVSSASSSVINCTFDENTATADGGGGAFVHFINDAPYQVPQFVNCLFTGNSGACGGAVLARSPVDLTNCTFTGNAAAGGGGLCLDDEATVINCVLWDNAPDAVAGTGLSLVTLTFSDVQGGYPGHGNIDADPVFVDPTAADYRLAPGSPCIDAGRSQMLGSPVGWRPALCDFLDLDQDGDDVELIPVDLDARSRFADDPTTPDTGCAAAAVIDMGAYEFGAPLYGDRVMYADLDGDGEVTVTDFLYVLGAWGPCEVPCCLADMSIISPYECRQLLPLDGVVDVIDVWAVGGLWGF